jgi:hypothetical protein
MKIGNFLIAVLFTLFATAQNELDFDMDATSARLGGYSDITYIITNNSSSNITNITINHPDAVVNSFVLNPSTLSPSASATASGRIAISGNRVNGMIPFLGGTQATVTGTMNSTTITELSDGNDTQGNRVDDGYSNYFISEPQNYGVIYVDDNLNSSYDPDSDRIIPGVTINVADDIGNQAILQTNETGWWYLPDGILFTENLAVIDRSSLPAPFTNYQPIDGGVPFSLELTLASQFVYENGFVPNSNIGTLQAGAFLDTNNNGTRESNEINVPHVDFEFISNNDPTTSAVINNGTGNAVFKLDFSPGNQLNDITATMGNNNGFFTVNTSFFDDITTTRGSTTVLDFAVSEVSSSNRDTSVYLANFISPNPGFESVVSIIIDNINTGTASGTFQFNLDPRAGIVSLFDSNGTDLLLNGTATLNASASSLSMSYSLNDFDQNRFYVLLSTPINGVQIGDTFTHMASINPTSIDNDASNNTATLNVDVVASYDPNDVTEARGEIIPINTFSNTDYLEYTIRFQNLGTASAQFVRVLSTLDPQLDPATFEMMTASHNFTYTKNANDLDWFFDNIQLAPEVNNPEASNGFIRYRIKPLPGFAAGDLIAASANIFFDYNAPVITETWLTSFDVPASLSDIKAGAVYPIPLKGNTLFFENIATGKAQLYSLDGKEVWRGEIANSQLILNAIDSGFYILKVNSEGNVDSIKLLKE